MYDHCVVCCVPLKDPEEVPHFLILLAHLVCRAMTVDI